MQYTQSEKIETQHTCSANCGLDKRSHTLPKHNLCTTEQVVAPHYCTSSCQPQCTLKGTQCLQSNHSLSVYVSNFPKDPAKETWAKIRDHFAPCGRILAIRTVANPSDDSVTDAMITFQDRSSAEKALDLNNTQFHQKIINVRSAMNLETSHLESLPNNLVPNWNLGTPVGALADTAYSLGDKIHQIGERMHEIDQYYQISENVHAVKEGLHQIDNQYHITSTATQLASQTKDAVISKAAPVLNKASETLHIPEATEAVQESVSNVKETFQEIGEYFGSLYDSVMNFVWPEQEKGGKEVQARVEKPTELPQQ